MFFIVKISIFPIFKIHFICHKNEVEFLEYIKKVESVQCDNFYPIIFNNEEEQRGILEWVGNLPNL